VDLIIRITQWYLLNIQVPWSSESVGQRSYLRLFCVAITKYLRVGTLWRKEVYLAYTSRGQVYRTSWQIYHVTGSYTNPAKEVNLTLEQPAFWVVLRPNPFPQDRRYSLQSMVPQWYNHLPVDPTSQKCHYFSILSHWRTGQHMIPGDKRHQTTVGAARDSILRSGIWSWLVHFQFY
jgi:hypothetical protein